MRGIGGRYGRSIDRRRFLRAAIAAGVGGTVLPSLALATASAEPARPGDSPYGPLADEPDENGLLLPKGFTSRVVGVAGQTVGTADLTWPAYPDGAACFPADDEGWIYVCNSEVFSFVAPDAGGVSAVRFDADGTIADAYPILRGSNSNCAGGPTPWGTWLSCEESADEKGRVWETDPTGTRPAVARPAMGLWAHEAAAVDPRGKAVYLTQDNPAGLFYRFTPANYPDLSAGRLEAAVVAEDGAVTWKPVPDPSAATTPTREQVPGATTFAGGEGAWYYDGFVYFTTKYDHSVHALDLAKQRHEVIWKGDPDRLGVEGAVLSGVDNITAEDATGDLYVAEDGGNMELVLITTEGVVAPFARIPGDEHADSEITGPCFNPAGDRLYFSSQRGPTPKKVSEIVPGAAIEDRAGGITYEVTGPFRGFTGETASAPSPSTTLAKAAESSTDSSGSDGGTDAVPIVVGGVVVAAAAAGGVIAFRRRRDHSGDPTL